MNEWIFHWQDLFDEWVNDWTPPPRLSALWLAESSVSLDVWGPGLGCDWTGNSQSYLWGGANLQRAAEELRVRLWRTKVHHQWETVWWKYAESWRKWHLLPVDDFLFFHPADSALPADSKNKKDYQASIVSFQAVFLNPGTWKLSVLCCQRVWTGQADKNRSGI